MNFRQLHQQSSPLLICNVWDVASAKVAEKNGYQAIGTSSAAIAQMLGYNDGEELLFEQLYFIVKRIIHCCSLPLTVDIEAGYGGNAKQVADNIIRLANLGVAGINIEDSLVNKERALVNSEEFSAHLLAIRHQLTLAGCDIFLNVRNDSFLLGKTNAVQDSIERITQYIKAGADGVFVPCLTEKGDIIEIVKNSSVPVNIMCMPNLPGFDELKTLGIKRISMGNFVFDNMLKHMENTVASFTKQQSFEAIF